MKTLLKEGGNVFKDANGNILTQRINRADVAPTVAWLEKLTGLPLMNNMLGSTGQKATSGDLDLAVDKNAVSKEDLVAQLSAVIKRQNLDPAEWIKKTGINVHFRTPIRGDSKKGYVQTDFMFLPKPDFSKFILRQDPDSNYKGASRNIMINSIAKSMGYKLNQTAGIMDRATNELISDNPTKIAQMLLTPGATEADLGSVEKILAALKNDPKRNDKIADFIAHMEREGTPIQETVDVESEVTAIARLRDRIVNQGMQPIMEGVRIEHPEDLVFDYGSRGVTQALNGILSSAKDPRSVTVKWDGKPAIIFGRKPDGTFVLTDKSGFLAKGYDGLATSPQAIQKMMSMRKGDRTELVALYARLFPLLKASVPDNFKGYVQGDLLFGQTPELKNGKYVFTPNIVTYSVDANSDIGKRIGSSTAGVAIHTALAAPGEPATPVTTSVLNPVKGLLLVDPTMNINTPIKIDNKLVSQIKNTISRYGSAIDKLFDPNELRSRRISDTPKLIKQYINSRVRSGNFNNLVQQFGPWVEAKSPAKAPRIIEWMNENKQGVAALFQSFLAVTKLKNSMVNQLDSQSQNVQATTAGQPGHEGYVGNNIKFVDRMKFSKANFAANNPNLS